MFNMKHYSLCFSFRYLITMLSKNKVEIKLQSYLRTWSACLFFFTSKVGEWRSTTKMTDFHKQLLFYDSFEYVPILMFH